MIAIQIVNGTFTQIALSDDPSERARTIQAVVGKKPACTILSGGRVQHFGKGVALITGRNRSGLTRAQINLTEREWRQRHPW